MVYDAGRVQDQTASASGVSEAVYTVKQLSSLARVSVRTLHYYDEIGLPRPSEVRSNGYRYYEALNQKIRRLHELVDIATFQELHPELPAYLEAAITQYVDDLETAEIERMLAEDEMERLRRLQ
jgi:DNA-binding transcriptional MerR regulator